MNETTGTQPTQSSANLLDKLLGSFKTENNVTLNAGPSVTMIVVIAAIALLGTAYFLARK